MRARAVLLSTLSAILCSSSAIARPWRAMMAPGDVAKQHAHVEEQCEKCHLVYKGVPNEKCLDCHAAIQTRMTKGEGFHATVKAQPCLDCHTDHQGRAGPMTRAKARSSFDHASTGFPLEGAHTKPGCEKCHSVPLDQLRSACISCHPDRHKGELGTRCETCHAGAPSASSWKAKLKTAADHRTSMLGRHGTLACKDCHARSEHLASKVGCGDCHQQIHGKTTAPCETCHVTTAFRPAKHDHSACTCKFPGKHITFPCLSCHPNWRFSDTPTLCSGCHAKTIKHEPLGECSSCHSPFSWKRRDVFDHNKRSTFKLADRHLHVDCARCHPEQGKFKGAPSACLACHRARGDAAHGDFGACDRCHTTTGFEKTSFDHASTGFVLSGRHARLKCQDCHASKTQGYPSRRAPRSSLPLRIGSPKGRARSLPHSLLALAEEHGGDAACTHCHEDAHRGTAGRECLRCHTTEAWSPSTFDQVRHAATRFPLEGKHAAARCTSCHVGGQLTGLPLDCAGCHLDRHRGRLGAECKSCHDPSGFKPVQAFDHARTGFALAGAHLSARCQACHEGRIQALIFAAARPPDCADCHSLGHGEELGARCEGCHPLELDASGHARPFKAARGMPYPEHAATGFPLERRHKIIACASCHPKSPAPIAKPIARCAQCHLDPHSGAAGNTCEDCHRADRFRLVRFDHDRAGWPLRGRHFVTPCMRCHTNQRFVGLPSDCWDCHARDAARAKMKVGLHPFGPLDCRDCHLSLWTWR
jgi:hypothetical protein